MFISRFAGFVLSFRAPGALVHAKKTDKNQTLVKLFRQNSQRATALFIRQVSLLYQVGPQSIMTETRKRVLSLFEAHRETPGTPFDESHFLDYLLANPRQNREVNNNFNGLRRLNAFRDQLQYEFGIFFSVKDREATYSLDRFIERIEELKSNPASSLASLRSPMKGKLEGIVVVGPLLFWVPAFVYREQVAIASLLFAFGAALLGFFIWIYWRERKYLNSLYVKIKASSKIEAQQGAPGDAAKRRA